MICTRANAEKLLKRSEVLRHGAGGWCIGNFPVLTSVVHDLLGRGVLVRVDDKKTRVGEEWGWDASSLLDTVKADFAGVELSMMDDMNYANVEARDFLNTTKDGFLYTGGMKLYQVGAWMQYCILEHENTYITGDGRWATNGSPGCAGRITEAYGDRKNAVKEIIDRLTTRIDDATRERATWLGQ